MANEAADFIVAFHVSCRIRSGDVAGTAGADEAADVVVTAYVSCGIGIRNCAGTAGADEAADIPVAGDVYVNKADIVYGCASSISEQAGLIRGGRPVYVQAGYRMILPVKSASELV